MTLVLDAWYYHHIICKIRIGSPYIAWQIYAALQEVAWNMPSSTYDTTIR